ncbi:hypothetical protein BIW11_13687, partial [Tropilaelaps mercedesae]
ATLNTFGGVAVPNASSGPNPSHHPHAAFAASYPGSISSTSYSGPSATSFYATSQSASSGYGGNQMVSRPLSVSGASSLSPSPTLPPQQQTPGPLS